MVRAIEALPIPAPALILDPQLLFKIRLICSSQWEDNVRTDTSSAGLLGKVISIPFGVHAWRVHAAPKIGAREAAVALLHVLSQIFGRAPHRVASKHAESLEK